MRQSSSFSKRQRTKRFFGASGSLVLFVLVVWGISALSRASFWSINSIQIGGIDQTNIPSLQANIDHILDGSYLGIFSRRNAILYPRSAISSYIIENEAQVYAVQVHVDGLHQLVISITQKTPEAIVCPTFPDSDSETNPEGCYFADKTGKLFGQAPALSNNVYPIYYAPELTATSTISTHVSSSSNSLPDFVDLQNIYANIRKAGIIVQSMLINENGEYELYVGNPTIVVYMNKGRPLQDQLTNFLTFWNNYHGKTATSSLDYIDVRYGSNVFFR